MTRATTYNKLRAETSRLLAHLATRLESVTRLEVAQHLGYGVFNAGHRLRALTKWGFCTVQIGKTADGKGAYQTTWYLITDKGREALSMYVAPEAAKPKSAQLDIKPRAARAVKLRAAPSARVTSVFDYGLSL